MKKGLIILLIIVLAIVASIAAIYALTNKEEGNQKVFVIGMDDSFPPYGFRNENNELVGLDIDIAQAVCDKLGWKLKVQPISWAAKEQEIDSGNIDCIWNGFAYTEDRASKMTVTDIYLKGGMIFVVKPDSEYTKQEDLKGKKVAVQTGSVQERDLENSDLGKQLGEIVQYSDYITAFMDLEAGGVDAVYISRVSGNYIIKSKNKDYKSIESEGINSSQGTVVAFKKGNTELRDIVENALYELKEEGKLRELSDKWFGEDLILLEGKK